MAQQKTTNPLTHLRNISILATFAMVSLGVNSCTEPSEYCKNYPLKADRTACTSYCAEKASLESAADNAKAVRACQLGQLEYLSNLQMGPGDAFLNCEHQFTENLGLAEACRAGVAAEVLRVSHSLQTHGTANDTSRETGNAKSH